MLLFCCDCTCNAKGVAALNNGVCLQLLIFYEQEGDAMTQLLIKSVLKNYLILHTSRSK